MVKQSGNSRPTPGSDGAFRSFVSALTSRLNLANRLGVAFGGDRKLHEQLGYPKQLTYDHYRAVWERGDVGARILELPAQATWQGGVMLHDAGDADPGTDSPFADEFNALATRTGLIRHLERADLLARMGQFAVLLLGVADGRQPDQPLGSGGTLHYLRALGQGAVSIAATDTQPTSPRYGLPTAYRVTLASGAHQSVHHSRIIHVAEHTLDDPVHGTPALERVYNRLMDLDKVVGGSAEMFWRGAFPGYTANVDSEAQLTPEVKEGLKEIFDQYQHGLRRVLYGQNVQFGTLGPSMVPDPVGNFEVLLKMLSGATGIPQRILVGNEAGELASSQDVASFANLIRSRRQEFAEPVILRPTVDRMIAAGLLSRPRGDGYTTQWTDPLEPSDEGKAELGNKQASALRRLYAPVPDPLRRQVVQGMGLDTEQVPTQDKPPEDPGDSEGSVGPGGDE